MVAAAVAGWIAPAATMVAALMTAANLGARVTGWGFVVFTIGAFAWCVVGLSTDQSNLLWSNGFLLAINVLGIWRWLGRVARYEKGGEVASQASVTAPCATLAPVSRLPGASIEGRDGEKLGTFVDAMLRCDDLRPAYFVVSVGGVGGVGETLYALQPAELNMDAEQMRAAVHLKELSRREPLAPDAWPSVLSSAQIGSRLSSEGRRGR